MDSEARSLNSTQVSLSHEYQELMAVVMLLDGCCPRHVSREPVTSTAALGSAPFLQCSSELSCKAGKLSFLHWIVNYYIEQQ